MKRILWITIVLILDQVTKFCVQSSASLPVTVIPGFFQIEYLKNTGAAWSMLSSKTALLTLVSAVAIGVMLWYLLTKKTTPVQETALCLMIAGAAGNIIDRLCLSNERDFLYKRPERTAKVDLGEVRDKRRDLFCVSDKRF